MGDMDVVALQSESNELIQTGGDTTYVVSFKTPKGKVPSSAEPDAGVFQVEVTPAMSNNINLT